jgi:hypothetical protein
MGVQTILVMANESAKNTTIQITKDHSYWGRLMDDMDSIDSLEELGDTIDARKYFTYLNKTDEDALNDVVQGASVPLDVNENPRLYFLVDCCEMHVLDFPLVPGESFQTLKMPSVYSRKVSEDLSEEDEDDFRTPYREAHAEPFEAGSRTGWHRTSFHLKVRQETRNRQIIDNMTPDMQAMLLRLFMAERRFS